MRTAYCLLFFVCLACTAPFLISAAQQSSPAPAPALPNADQTLQYLKQTIDWHQQIHEEEQLATSSAEVMLLNEAHQYSQQILQLSFDFAKAQAKLLLKQSAPSTTEEATEVTGYSGLARAAAAADKQVRETQTELDGLKQKIQTAEGQRQRQLQSSIDELQSELNLAKTRSDTFRNILQFVGTGSAGGTNLQSQVDELQKSVPELEADTAKSSGSPTSAAPAPPAAVQQSAVRNQAPTGILELITNLFSLSSKIRAIDRSLQSTDALATASQHLRSPVVKNMIGTAQRGEELAKEADTSGPAELEQQKRELDTLTARFKEISSVMVPLGRQNILFGLYKSTLTRWKTSVQNEYSVELRGLIVRAVLLGFALGVVFTLSEIWRKATLRYVRDLRRRHQFLVLRRIVVWCAVGITIAFALATEIGSLATFAGLITAGIAVALQNLIMAVAGYFFLVGKYGVRIGDRVQISGVTGNVVDIGLVRLHLMELAGAGSDRQPTGRVVVFSNAVVFQPTASFYKQIPGTNFGWHEVTLTLSPDTEYHVAEERLLGAVKAVYSTYSEKIEEQHRHMENSFALALDVPQPKSRLRLTQTGLEVVIRYPLELDRSAEIDDQIIRELLTALERPPKLKLVGSGTPNIQPVLDGHSAA
jgi:small-conductance mechanosensitive channel